MVLLKYNLTFGKGFKLYCFKLKIFAYTCNGKSFICSHWQYIHIYDTEKNALGEYSLEILKVMKLANSVMQ